jgi:hypothetical protein
MLRDGWLFSDAASGWADPITTKGADYAHHITASPPRFENPAASLLFVFFEITRVGIIHSTVAINDLLCMKNAGAQIAMDFS